MKQKISSLFSSLSIGAGAILFFISILLFLNSAFNQFAIDDKGIILENRFFVEGTTLGEIFSTNYRFGANTPDGLYRPFAMLTFQLNYLTTGLDPAPFHIFNIILNALNAILFFSILKKLTGRLRLSFIASLLFACHPIHSESVASITGRPEILYTFLIFISWLVLESDLKPLFLYSCAGLALFGALLTKETAVVFPFMVFVADFLKRKKIPFKRMLFRGGILIGVVLIYLVIRWIILGETVAGNIVRYYDNPLYYMDVMPRLVNALMILGRYIILLIVPYRLLSDYSYRTFPLVSMTGAFFPVIIFMVFVGLITIAFIYRNKRPEYTIGAVFFLFPFLVISNILMPIGTIMGERLMYLPSAGMMLVMAGGIDSLLRRWKAVVMTMTGLYLLFFSAQTVMRNYDWYDDYTITTSDFPKAPENVKLIANMGYFAKQEGDSRKAEEYYRRALDIYPEFGEGWSGLARMAYERGDMVNAEISYRKAAECAPRNVIAQFNYASVLINGGQFIAAEEWLTKAMAINPDAPILYRSMGNLNMSQENFVEAITYYEEAFRRGDSKTICYNNIAASAYYQGRYDLSWRYVQKARQERINLNPDLVQSIQEQLYTP
ncbi:tetratricopeptide repeat protein [Candidatus Latescibacterota bacterium]